MSHDYRNAPDLADSPDLSWSTRGARWFLRETGHWLVPLTGSLMMGGMGAYVLLQLSHLTWATFKAALGF